MKKLITKKKAPRESKVHVGKAGIFGDRPARPETFAVNLQFPVFPALRETSSLLPIMGRNLFYGAALLVY